MCMQNRNRLSDIENKLMVTKEQAGKGQIRGMGLTDTKQTTIKIDKQQEYAIQHKELYSLSCNNL